MRTKSKYREIKSENIPIEKELPPVEAVIAEPQAVAVVVEPQPQAEQPKPQAADEPALALSKQLDALKQSEEIQRQQAAQLQQPSTREQRLALWRQQGLSDAELHFLSAHPDMIDYPQITGQAAGEAKRQGHQRDSQAFMEAMTVSFNKQLDQMRAQPAEQPTPEFFRPPAPPAPPTRTNIVSAPVSRSVPTGRPREENPNRMVLTAEELEIAKASGISAVEYAKGKQRLLREKASGERT